MDLRPADINGDSVDELIAVLDDATVEPRDQNMLSAGGTASFEKGTFRAAAMAGALDSAHIWVTFRQHDTAFVYDVTGGRRIPCAAGEDYSRVTDGWDGGIFQAAAADLDADGRIELVTRVSSTWDRRPRGIFLLDWESGLCTDSFLCGSGPTTFTLRDINADGRLEVVFGTWAPGNGNNDNGLADSLTYVVALDSRLAPLWVRRLGRYSSQVTALLLTARAGRPPVLLACENGNSAGGRTRDSIFRLDPADGSRLAATQVGTFNTAVAALEDPGLGTLVAVANADDTLRLLDSRLQVVSRTRVPGMSDGVGLCAGHFTGRRSQDLVVTTTGGKIMLLDSRLRPLVKLDARLPSFPMAARFGRRDRLLVQTQMDSARTWRLYEMQMIPFLSRSVAVGTVLPGAAVLLALFTASIVLIRFHQTRDMRAVIRGLTGQAGVVELSVQGRVRRTNLKARELLGSDLALPAGPLTQGTRAALAEPVGSPSREFPITLEVGKTVLARIVRVRSGVMLTLEDISAVEYLRRVQSWVPVAQKLAHGIKNPLTAIGLTLQLIEKQGGPAIGDHVESLKDDVERLRRMTDSFMRFTKLEAPKLTSQDMAAVVSECLDEFDSVRPAGVTIRRETGDGLPPVLLDRAQFRTALDNVVENAISAMGQSGILSVNVRRVGSERVAIAISDTGPGIPERYLGKVFEPFFTLKPGGTGLGMALTKRIVEDHKGTIRIESREGAGTTVVIELPAA